jgi:uncharacterized protein
MSLVETLDADFKAALRAKDQEKLSLLRLVRSAVKNLEITKQGAASDEDVVEIIQREVKQHKESIEANENAKRPEEVARLQKEVEMLASYLPEQLSGDQIKDIISGTIEETNARGVSEFGKVMGAVMPKLAGKASGDVVGQMVKELLEK